MSEQNSNVPDGMQLTPFDPDFYADPYAVYARLRESEPVHRDVVSMYAESWTVSGYSQVRALLRHPNLSANAEDVDMRRDPRVDNPVTLRDPDMMNLEGEAHRRLRKLVDVAFRRTAIHQMKDHIHITAVGLLDAAAGDQLDVLNAYAKPLPTMVIANYLGFDVARHEDLKAWTDTLLLQGYPIPSDDQWQQIVAADAAMRSYTREVIEAKRAEPGDDLTSALLAAQVDDDSLTHEDVENMLMLLVGAGNFTTTDLICNALLALLQHPQALEYLLEDPSARVEQVVTEVLRYDGPSLVARRFVTADTPFEGVVFKRGSVINLLLGAANHDPAQFEHPDTFDVTRAKTSHLAFAHGPHHCIGSGLAQLETQIAVLEFFKRFPEPQLALVKRGKNMSFRGCSRLIMDTGTAA